MKDSPKPAKSWQWLWRIVVVGLIAYPQPSSSSILLMGLDWSFWATFVTIAIYCNFQLVVYYFFWFWIYREATRKAAYLALKSDKLKEEREFVIGIKRDLEETGILNKIISHASKVLQNGLNHDNRYFKIVKSESLVAVFILACTPLWGSKSITIIPIGVSRLRRGLCALIAGNIICIAYIVGAAALVKNLLGGYYFWFMVIFYTIMGILVLKPLIQLYLSKRKSP